MSSPPTPRDELREKGNNWLLSMPSTYSEEELVSALRHSGQKGFMKSLIILAENRSMEKIAILHLKKSIRKRQVDRLFKFKIERGNGSLDDIKSNLKSRGYDLFSTITVPENKDMTEAKIAENKDMSTEAKIAENKDMSTEAKIAENKDMSTEAKIAEMGLAEYSTEELHRKLLHCLEKDAGLDISGCTELPQAVQMACEAIKMLTMRSRILFTYNEDLQNDIKQFPTQIDALKVQTKGLTELFEAELKVQQDQYKELKEQFENLRTRHSKLVRRESDTLGESSRRIEEWMAKFGNST
jgi:hypothetical protein